MQESMLTTNPVDCGLPIQPLPSIIRWAERCSKALRLSMVGLTPEQLIKAASEKTKLAPNLPDYVFESLEVLCRSYHDDANLHWFGHMNQLNLVLTGLVKLLQVQDIFQRQPELDETPLIAPLFVIGLPRSGTTFLHRLLASAPDANSVALYQHIDPVAKKFFDVTRYLDAEMRFWPWKMVSKPYSIDAIHLVRPKLADECNFGMRLGAQSMIYWATAATYQYIDWLLQQDLRESYQLYRRVLILHQRQNPTKRLILKCPHHLAWLPALCQAIPEAILVQTHRDPLQVVASESKLILSLQSMTTHQLDSKRTVQCNKHKVATYAQRSVDFFHSELGSKVFHVDYSRLLSDPVTLCSEILQNFNLPFTAEHQTHLTNYFGNNRQHKHGKNIYSNDQFQLDQADLENQFADYRNLFIVNGLPTQAHL